MENNDIKSADNTTLNCAIYVNTNDNRTISLDTFREEFEWIRDDLYNLVSRVRQLEEENRMLKEKIESNDFQSMMDRNKVNMLNDIYNECFSKMKKVSDYVGEMSKDYIKDFVYMNTE